MKYLLAAICLGFIAWTVIQHFRQLPALGPQERFFAIRAWAFTGLVGFIFLLGFLFLPNKGRIVMLLPIFLFGVGSAKWMRKNRERLRREEQERSSFERAKRVN